MRGAAPNRSRDDIRLDDFSGSSERLVADLAPSPDGTVLLDGQLGFDDRNPVESVAPPWRVGRPAELLSRDRGQRLVEQAQMWIEDVVRRRGTGPSRLEYPPDGRRFLELHKQRLGEAPGMIQPFGDQLARRRLPRDPSNEFAGGRIVGRTTKYGHMRLELDGVEPRRQINNDRTQPRSKRFARRQPQCMFGVGDRSSLIIPVGQTADLVASEGGFAAKAAGAATNATGTRP